MDIKKKKGRVHSISPIICRHSYFWDRGPFLSIIFFIFFIFFVFLFIFFAFRGGKGGGLGGGGRKKIFFSVFSVGRKGKGRRRVVVKALVVLMSRKDSGWGEWKMREVFFFCMFEYE